MPWKWRLYLHRIRFIHHKGGLENAEKDERNALKSKNGSCQWIWMVCTTYASAIDACHKRSHTEYIPFIRAALPLHWHAENKYGAALKPTAASVLMVKSRLPPCACARVRVCERICGSALLMSRLFYSLWLVHNFLPQDFFDISFFFFALFGIYTEYRTTDGCAQAHSLYQPVTNGH